jgi:esterase/lipase superfamily enzyme
MNIEYHSWWSPRLGQEMGLKVYGYYGKPVLAFPAQGGRFYDFENFGMVEAAAPFIEAGQVKLFAVDSVDNQSWANYGVHPYDRAWRHESYDGYITEEVVPFIRQHCAGDTQKLLTTGCSMGGYHAANFFFRHPNLFDATIALSGLFHLNMFVGDYMDEMVYFNSPLHFLPGLEDPWYLDQYRQSQIIIGVGCGAWEEEMIADASRLQEILAAKQIPAWIDFWGNDVNHDWPWWRKMLPYFLGEMRLSGVPDA